MNVFPRMRGVSLKRMMIFSFVLSMLFAVCLLLFSVAVYLDAMSNSTRQAAGLYASEQAKLLSDELQTMKTVLYSLSAKAEIQDYLVKNQGYRASTAKYIQSSLDDVASYVSCIDDVAFATQDRHTIYSYTKNDMRNYLLRESLMQLAYVQQNSGTSYHTLSPTSVTEYFFAVTVPFRHSGQTGFVTAFSTIDSLLKNLKLSQADYALYREDELIYANCQTPPSVEAMKEYASHQVAGEYGAWLHFSVPAAGWEMLVESPVDTQDGFFSSEILRWSFFSLLIFAVIDCGLMLSIFRTIVEPISNISHQSQQISSASMQIRNPSPNRTELALLVDNINAMIRRTNQLTTEVNAAQLKLLEMEIANLEARNMFLQVQINPHFLYNTLECICGMAAQKGDFPMREMAYSLSRLYRYCLNAPESTLGEELESIAMYENVIRQRYQDDYRLEVDISEDYSLLPLPRMTMEPLVENAFQHGFVHGCGKIFIVIIKARLEQDLLTITISDNGLGIPDELRAQMQARLDNAPQRKLTDVECIGMFNVATRLKLLYGTESGLYLDRNSQGGLDVNVRIRYPLAEAEVDRA